MYSPIFDPELAEGTCYLNVEAKLQGVQPFDMSVASSKEGMVALMRAVEDKRCDDSSPICSTLWACTHC